MCKFYESKDDVQKVVNEILSQDMRSGNTARRRIWRGEKATSEGMKFCFDFDGLRIKSISVSETKIRVLHVEDVKLPRRENENDSPLTPKNTTQTMECSSNSSSSSSKE